MKDEKLNECGYYDPYLSNGDCIIQGLGTNDSILYCWCKDNPNCYYKQLQTLKTENEELRKYKDVVDKLAGMQIILTNKEKMPILYENAKDLKISSYKQALEKIEETATDLRTRRDYHSPDEVNADIDKILNIINEVTSEK